MSSPALYDLVESFTKRELEEVRWFVENSIANSKAVLTKKRQSASAIAHAKAHLKEMEPLRAKLRHAKRVL